MLAAYLPLLAILFGAGLVLTTALVLTARYGPHRLWSLAMFIACVALIIGSRIGDYGIPILYGDMSGFTLALKAVARASLASALTIQCLRATRAATPWQVGAGTVAGEATLLTGVGFMDGC
jgi:hypothetical protein